ncbi:uncharacterized protein LOC120082160 isoform X3 [Benincasa hispida]|uniref:uncharacterized protein LOC120082160 isoform X3 n=1 Tax=Benincasa hispida TaxID=102211 RepID=UPI0018FFF4F6|nr:uncharacterized protein LOC120082160 isoform X3 [Benincasa hispida]
MREIKANINIRYNEIEKGNSKHQKGCMIRSYCDDDCIGSNSTLKTTRNYDCASAIVCTCEENLLLSEPEISETRLLCFLYQEFLSQSQVQYKYLSCSPQSCPSNCLLLLE